MPTAARRPVAGGDRGSTEELGGHACEGGVGEMGQADISRRTTWIVERLRLNILARWPGAPNRPKGCAKSPEGSAPMNPERSTPCPQMAAGLMPNKGHYSAIRKPGQGGEPWVTTDWKSRSCRRPRTRTPSASWSSTPTSNASDARSPPPTSSARPARAPSTPTPTSSRPRSAIRTRGRRTNGPWTGSSAGANGAGWNCGN
jgi:hypothetical protein